MTADDDVSTGATTEAGEEVQAYKLSLDVDIQSAGPCKQHVRIRIPQTDIEHYRNEAVEELCTSASVPGFRIGHVPRKLVERKFKKELSDQLKNKLLFESLEQLGDGHDFDPINEPNIDVEAIEIPDEGDFEYEFDVEVRPEFDLPDYAGLKIERPVKDVTDEDVNAYLDRYLSQYGRMVESEEPAKKGDYIALGIEIRRNGEPLRGIPDQTVHLLPVLRFWDAELEGFDDLLKGAKPGDVRKTTITVSREAESVEMRGEKLEIQFEVKKVLKLDRPELTREFLEGLAFDSEDDLRQGIREVLERQVTFEQRQATRRQVLAKITESANWDLPEELVLKHVENALRREILEMQQAGFTTQQIRARENELRQQAVSTTRQALKEHFVLDKIAEKENIQVEPSDIEAEIRAMAAQRGESARRVRARLTKSGMIENLEAQLRELKAVDVVLSQAQFKDVKMPAPAADRVATISRSVCGIEAATPDAESEDEAEGEE